MEKAWGWGGGRGRGDRRWGWESLRSRNLGLFSDRFLTRHLTQVAHEASPVFVSVWLFQKKISTAELGEHKEGPAES